MLKSFMKLWGLVGCAILIACQPKTPGEKNIIDSSSWAELASQAKGSTVNFMMWQGSPVINDYINNYLVPKVKKELDIDLKISGGQGPEIVQLIMGEKQAEVSKGQIDIVWINGETFFQLKQIEGLWGPFVDRLPNSQYIDFEDPYISIDFQQRIEGMECPWGITQFAMVYDTSKITSPPRSLKELEAFIRLNPGTFTISNDFTGMSLLKIFLAELSGMSTGLDGPFDQKKYDELSLKLWRFINENKKYFWKEGSTFPKEQSKMDQLFASGELLITYGFGEGGVEDKVRQGLFPKTTRAYTWKNGTIKNSNYLGIPYNSPNKAAAMQVINFMISPEAQLKRMIPDEMNSATVLSLEKLSSEWKKEFQALPARLYGPSLEDLKDFAIKEPAPEYMLNVYKDFRTEVIER